MSFCMRYFIDRLILITSIRFWQKLYLNTFVVGVRLVEMTPIGRTMTGQNVKLKKRVGIRRSDSVALIPNILQSLLDTIGCIGKVSSKDVPDKRLL